MWKNKKPALFKFEKQGDHIEGQIKNTKDTEFGKSYEIETPDGKSMYFFGSTSIDRQLADCNGSVCKITYLGDVKTKSGRTMKDFEVLEWAADNANEPP